MAQSASVRSTKPLPPVPASWRPNAEQIQRDMKLGAGANVLLVVGLRTLGGLDPDELEHIRTVSAALGLDDAGVAELLKEGRKTDYGDPTPLERGAGDAPRLRFGVQASILNRIINAARKRREAARRERNETARAASDPPPPPPAEARHGDETAALYRRHGLHRPDGSGRDPRRRPGRHRTPAHGRRPRVPAVPGGKAFQEISRAVPAGRPDRQDLLR